MRGFARWLVEYGTRRDAVAAGIVLLGLTGDERDRDLLLLLGALEDLTLYAVVALARTQPDPEIRGWLLREGFRNEVMDEYLAHLAATTGDLYTALLDPEPDEALLNRRGRHHRRAVRGRRPGRGHPRLPRWGRGSRQELQDKCHVLARRPPWRMIVEDALASPDLPTFRLALWPAAQLRIPTRERVRARLRTAPFDGYLWQSLLNGCPGAEINDLTILAQELLPLADLASGAASSTGLGPSYLPDHALDLIVSRLAAYPGHGWILIKTALRSRVIRCRNMAVRTLTQWAAHTIPADAPAAVRDALRAEPEAKTRDAMEHLLSAWQA